MGHTEDTISQWLKEISLHAEIIEGILLSDYKLDQARIVGLTVKTLRLKNTADSKSKWIKRTPAMAAQLTDHIWTLKELFDYVTIEINNS